MTPPSASLTLFLNETNASTQAVVTGTSIGRLANGKFIEGWTNADMLGLLLQLGAGTAPDHAAS